MCNKVVHKHIWRQKDKRSFYLILSVATESQTLRTVFGAGDEPVQLQTRERLGGMVRATEQSSVRSKTRNQDS